MKVIVIKSQNMDYVKKGTTERVIATKASIIYPSTTGYAVTEVFIKNDSLDYQFVHDLVGSSICECEMFPQNTKYGLSLVFARFKKISDLNLNNVINPIVK